MGVMIGMGSGGNFKPMKDPYDASSKAVNEGSNADRIAAIRKRVACIEHMPYLDAAQTAARVALSEDVPWLLDALDAAEARAERDGLLLLEIAGDALAEHHAACTYCRCDRMDLCRDWNWVKRMAALDPFTAERLGYTKEVLADV